MGAAAVAFGAALEHNPDHAGTYLKLGEVLLQVGHIKDAEASIREAIEIDPDSWAPHLYLSMALDRTPHCEAEALAEVERALELDPTNLFVGNWYATMLTRRGRHAEATEQYRRMLAIDPDHVATLTGYGSLTAGQAKIESAWDLFSRAINLSGDDPQPVAGALFFANANPALSPQALFDLHREWAQRQNGKSGHAFTAWDNTPDPDRRIKIGYLSPDLRGHSVSNFLQPIMAHHDKSRFEIVVLDNAPRSDQVSVHLHALSDHWVRIVGGGVDRVCDIVRELQIDILVDLAGHTSDNRLDVFARHPAPVQVSYLGYPNTTGLPEMDYRLTDAIVDPPGDADVVHSEKLVRLPGGFLCFNPPPPPPEVGPLPCDVGDVAPNVTFTSFNAVHKINRSVIALWTRVLDAVPGSKMLLKAVGLTDGETRRNIIEAFAACGVKEDRLILVERTAGYVEHLQIYNRCDIALDTFPYNGTTTTCEAMFMGVPVIGLAGDRHASRVGTSILTHLGLPELSASTPDDFVRIAAALANDRPRLRQLRSTLRDTMRSSRLMDGSAHAAAIEDAYSNMWKSWCVSQASSRRK